MLAESSPCHSASMDGTPAATTQHFFTAALQDSRSTVFTEYAEVLRLAFRICRDRYPFSLTAGVILPDHLHFILALPTSDKVETLRWRLLQGLLERVAGGGDEVWQTFEARPLGDEAELQRRIDDIHGDPVRHGLVRLPRKWRFSSLHAYVEHGLRPLHWSGNADGAYGTRIPGGGCRTEGACCGDHFGRAPRQATDRPFQGVRYRERLMG